MTNGTISIYMKLNQTTVKEIQDILDFFKVDLILKN